jgi:hypothetical protein
VSVLLGNGDGTFGAKTDFGTGADPNSVAIGDLNGDGKPDLAVANEPSNTVSVLLGNGDGTFGAKTDFGTGASPNSVAIGDLNGDGKPDLAVANYLANTVSVLLGNGDGTFGAKTDYGTGAGASSVAIGDLNGDGKPDLAVADYNSNTVSVLLSISPISTAVEVALLDATSDAGRVHIRWSVSEPQGATAAVERRTETDPWGTKLGPTAITGSIFAFDDPDVTLGHRYAYRLIINSSEGTITTPETWVDVSGEAAPRAVALGRPAPNPSGGAIRVRLGLPREGPADLSVFDVSGRLVARVSIGLRPAGWHQLAWDGRDRNGRPVASGTYFLRLNAGETVSRRFVVLR